MTAKIFIEGEIGVDTTLLSVMTQYKNISNPTDVEVWINSIGGEVQVGNAIYSFLKGLPIPVKTIAIKAYSIAASIFMAGSERVVTQGADKLMIHFPFVMGFTGGSDDLSNMSKELKSLENEMVSFYKEHVDIDDATLRNLLATDTFISGDEAFMLGFATSLELPQRAVARLSPKPSKQEDNINNDKNSIMTKFDELIQSIKNFGKPADDAVVALVLQDANGVEITFPDVADDAVPAEGDLATVDGAPAEGEYVTPFGEKWVFVDGALSEVLPAEPADDAPVDELPTEESLSAEQIDTILKELFAKAAKDSKAALDLVKAEYETKLAKVRSDNTAEIVALKKLIGSPELGDDVDEAVAKKKAKNNSLAATFRG